MDNQQKQSFLLPNIKINNTEEYKPPSKLVVKIIISNLCKQSNPCQHECKLIYSPLQGSKNLDVYASGYNDGRVETRVLGARYIVANYYHLLSLDDKKHFSYLK
jgi:hypothetical protein